MTTTGAFAVGIAVDGGHPAGWRYAEQPPERQLSAERLTALVKTAERAGFSYVIFDDSPLPPGTAPNVTGRLDAVQLAVFAGPLTSRIGLVAQTEVVFSEPFHVATQLASLDHATLGRAGWWVAASGSAELAAGYGRPAVIAPASLRREASDVIEVSRRLWDSWEDDAVIRDRVSGRYLDGDRLHHVDFNGATFSVRGPLITPRPPQGQPVVFAPWAGADPIGVDVTVIEATSELEAATTADRARTLGTARVVAEVEVLLDLPDRTAAQRLVELDRHADWPARGLRHVGDPAGLVALLRRLSGAVDGVVLRPAVIDLDLAVLERAVLPALREHGKAVPPPAGGTLRQVFGLPRPANRYAAAAGR
ncbi:LLM class flavin-dependent oxidoreductase [Microlunatus sp. GCM10028923]|uniref:LLM class flavin-dependent oxidoreductase n=1 Tax=Microlunatus sp. GCM10028923 TaxID=3273400 RepID=UPI003617CD8F